jgi:hypothetical protein
VFCPEHCGWHVGEWWTIDGPGRWVLAFDASIDLPPVSHVMDTAADPMDTSAAIQWAVMRQVVRRLDTREAEEVGRQRQSSGVSASRLLRSFVPKKAVTTIAIDPPPIAIAAVVSPWYSA